MDHVMVKEGSTWRRLCYALEIVIWRIWARQQKNKNNREFVSALYFKDDFAIDKSKKNKKQLADDGPLVINAPPGS